MEILNLEQGSDEWLKARLGMATASEFNKIITPTGLASKQIDDYANKLLAEMIVGAPVDEYTNEWMQRGNDLEEEAVNFYEFYAETKTEKVGFVVNHGVGCSPDRFIGDSGLLEVKVPAPHNHVKYLLGGEIEAKYRPQIQGQMHVTEREWVDIYSYHPSMPPVIIRQERDKDYIAKLADGVVRLYAILEEKINIAKEKGLIDADG